LHTFQIKDKTNEQLIISTEYSVSVTDYIKENLEIKIIIAWFIGRKV